MDKTAKASTSPTILDDFIFASFRPLFYYTVAFQSKKVTPLSEEKVNLGYPFGCLKKSSPSYVKSRPAAKIPVTLSTPGTTLREM
jgi:hypothetical protein